MQSATALYCVDLSTPDLQIQQAAEEAAKQDVHLAVFLHAEFPRLPIGVYGAMPYAGLSTPEAWSNTLKSAQSELKDRVNQVEKLVANESTFADVIPHFATESDVQMGIAQVARTCDLAFIAPDVRKKEELYKEMLHGILFQSPIPALVNGKVGMPKDTVLLAWNDSLASARAAHLALPIFEQASNVHIVCFDAPATAVAGKIEPGREAAAWLSHHGCNVTLTQLPSGGREIGSCILDHASEIGADLVVAGAYGHSRLKQAVFGGTSRTLFEQKAVPVFAAH